MMKIFVATAIIFTCLSASHADSDLQIYCGRVLAEKMNLLCYPGNNSDDVKKRSMNDVENFEAYQMLDWYRPRVYPAHSALRGKRGIIDDCCFQPCSMETLRSYCWGSN